MAIKEQGFGEGVNLAQKALNQSLRIGQKIEQSGAEIENYLDAENIQNQTVELRTQLKEINTAANGDINAFRNASEEALANLSKNSRNSKIQAKLEREFKIQQSSYLNQMELSNRAQIKNTNNIKTAQFIQSNNEEMAKANLNGDVDYSKELYDTNLEALKASYDNGDLTEAEYLLRVQKEEINATQSRLQVALQNDFDIINEGIKNEQIKDINIIKEISKETIKAIENPQDYKELWGQRGYNIVDGNVIDKVTGKEVTAEQLEKLKQQAEINSKKFENSFLKKNEELINESNQNTLFVNNSFKEGKTFFNEQLTMLEERDAQILGEEVAYKKWEKIKNLNNFLKDNSPKERGNILKDKDFLKNDPRMKAQYKAYSDINADAEIKDPMQFGVNNGLSKVTEISLKQDPEIFKANILQRLKEAGEIGTDRGIEYPVMTNKETQQLAQNFDKLPSDVKAVYSNILYTNLPPEQLTNIGEEAFKVNENSSLIRSIDLQNRYTKSPDDVGLDMLTLQSEGATILQNVPDFYSKKHSDSLQTALATQTQGYYDAKTIGKRPNDFKTIMDIYTANLANEGKNGETEGYDKDVLTKSINQFYGEILEMDAHGVEYKLQTPNSNISPEEFEDRINNLNPAQLQIISQLPEGFEPEEVIEGIQDGDYRLRAIQIANETDLVYELVQSDGSILADNTGNKHFLLSFSDFNGENEFTKLSTAYVEEQELLEQGFDASLADVLVNDLGDIFNTVTGAIGKSFKELQVRADISGRISSGIVFEDEKEIVEKIKQEKAEKLKSKIKKAENKEVFRNKFNKLDNLLNDFNDLENSDIYNEEHLKSVGNLHRAKIREIEKEISRLRLEHSQSNVGIIPFNNIVPKDIMEKINKYKGE